MKRILVNSLIAVFVGVFLAGMTASPISASTSVSKADVIAFQAAGSEGGGDLSPGDMFPPTSSGKATLHRKGSTIKVHINTSGLPPGAYTLWWVVWNKPGECDGPCGEDDIGSVGAENSIFWAGYDIVSHNGKGNFIASYTDGDLRTQEIFSNGGVDPATAEVHNIIKYHGPASSDPGELFDQTHTALGLCDTGANGVPGPAPGVTACFDPQAVVHPLP